MFEFLRALIPGRAAKEPASSATTAAIAAKSAGRKAAAKDAGGKAAVDRPTFGQKPKAVYKPAHSAKRRSKH